ncbi:MAG: alpha/beta fold hydrolase [Veillonellales bacterium]
MKTHVFIEGRQQLSAMIHNYGNVPAGTPLVIFCHGFTGDKIGSNQLMLHIAQAIEADGKIAVRFDFAGSGESGGEFAEDTRVSGWQEDLQSVVSWVKNQPEFIGAPIFLLGHSLGGLVALTYPDDAAIAGRMALSAVVYPVETFSAEEIFGKGLWEKAAAGETIANFFNKGFSLNNGIFANDLIKGKYKPLEAAEKLTTPLLIIHGTADCVVPLGGSEELYRRYKGKKIFHKLDGADHVFSGRHADVQTVIVDWLHKWEK